MGRKQLSEREKRIKGTWRPGREAARLNPPPEKAFHFNRFLPTDPSDIDRDANIIRDGNAERFSTDPTYQLNVPGWCEEINAAIAKHRANPKKWYKSR
jgi:hypothetical protein